MSAPPTLQIGVGRDGAGMVHPSSFEDFDRWMRANEPHYHLISDHADALALTGEDRLRYLLAAMCVSARAWKESAHDATRRAAQTFYVVSHH